jgi:hypothetical protein
MQANRWTNHLALVFALGVGSLPVATDSHAGTIGYFKEGDCAGYAGDYAARISAAGHIPIPLSTLDSASLASLDGLVLASSCNGTYQATNAAVNDAVANGMALLLQFQGVPPGPGVTVQLPGLSSLPVTQECSFDVSPATGSPIANGPGGTLTDDALDNPELCGLTGWVASNALPASGTPLLVAAAEPTRIGAFGYSYGNGRVVLSMDQIQLTMTGGLLASRYPRPGSDTYITNTIAWLMPGIVEPDTTCASEGYTGTKLTWCKNICEKGYTGATLDMWLHRWINRYRDLPYCAAGSPPPPPQEG